ncbi:MAG: bile acid:sodium symporter family protein [Bacteroidales bacterium]|nr:bile acid:sodium symporter family protein [Bacteroidales bacterium]
MSIFIVLPILTLLMFDLGLTLQVKDFKLFLTHPKPVLVGLVGQLVFLPLVAMLLTQFLNLPAVFVVGFVLIACCPGGSSSNVFSMLAKGDVALSVSLTALSSIITLFTLPVIMEWTVAKSDLLTEAHIQLPIGKLIMQNIFTMLLPIVLGILLRKYAVNAATRIEKVLSKIAFPALVFLATVFFVQEFDAIKNNIGEMGLAVLALILVCIGLGALLAYIFRLRDAERRTIIIEVGMQNAAQAIALATSPFVFNDAKIAIPAILYALLMNVVLLIYTAVIRRTAK